MSTLFLAALAGCGGAQDQKRFVAEQRAAAAGHRFEHFEQERLLFVHRPNGARDGIELATLRRVVIHRVDARDSVDGTTTFWWHFTGRDGTLIAPFFSVEPRLVVGILAKELAGFDEAAALKMVVDFEEGRAGACQLWASPEYLKELGAAQSEGCAPGPS